MSQTPSYRLSPTITNGFGLASLIAGIAGFCLPVAGGLTALVLGFVGIQRSRDTHTGKGLSIAGMVLGGISIVFWLIFGSTILTAFHLGKAVINSATVEPPRLVVEQFLRDVTGNNLNGAQASSGISSQEINLLHDQVKDLGLVQSVENTSFSSTPDGDNSLQGVVTFDKGQRHYTAHALNAGGTYRVTSLAISP
jgi:hypothetical protein